MTDAKLTARVKRWQRRLSLLGVGHWRVSVEVHDKIDTPGDLDPQAQAEPSAKYDSVLFKFNRKDVEDAEAEGTLDELIVHEWLHVVDRTQDEIVHVLLYNLPSASREVVEDREEAARERRIENVARLIVKLVHSSEPNKES